MPDNNQNNIPPEGNQNNNTQPEGDASLSRNTYSSSSRVTWRMPDSPITRRMVEEAVTTRLSTKRDTTRNGSSTADVLTLKPDDLVEKRFRVIEGPLGKNAGEAEIFKCQDELLKEVIILKLYRYQIFPRKEVLDKLVQIRHPNLIGLKQYGYWNGRFYEIMEYCEGGSLADFMPLDEAELKQLILPIANGLEYCHSQQIIHRDIKPSNFFYRREGQQELVIGDFGISSLLDTDQKVRRTQTYKNLTMDYAAPELLSREEVSPKTDYYALGITLLHIMTGASPFAGNENPTSILAAHLTGNISMPEIRSDSIQQLLRGLLQLRPENRWGYSQLMQWYHGEPVFTDKGIPWKDEIFSGIDVPFPAYPEAKNPKELAKYLGKFDAAIELFRGNIFRWVYDHFDPQMAEAIKQVEENYASQPSLAVFKLRYILDPAQAFRAGHYWVKSLDDILKMILLRKPDVDNIIGEALYGEYLESWIEGTLPASVSRSLVPKIRKIREENPNKKGGIAALMYVLDPTQPLWVDDVTQIYEPEDIGKYLKERPDLEPLLRDMVFSGKYQSWLEIVFPQRKEEVDFINKCLVEMEKVPDQAWNAITWFCYREASFLFMGHSYSDTASLADAIDESSHTRQAGLEVLKNNTLRNWLLMTGRLAEPKLFDDVMKDPITLPQAKLEAILHLLDPNMPWPKPAASVKIIDLGRVKNNGEKKAVFMVHNESRGHLSGIITLQQEESNCFLIDPVEIEGGPVDVCILVRPLGHHIGEKLTAEILIETNGGSLKIPVTCQVSAPFEVIFAPSLNAGIILAVILGISRFLISISSQEFGSRATRFFNYTDVTAFHGAGTFLFIMDILLVVLGAGIYYVWKMMRNSD
jgi:serine/threonine protein kinase